MKDESEMGRMRNPGMRRGRGKFKFNANMHIVGSDVPEKFSRIHFIGI